eukprot:746797-Hanusia_phi.AAC.3
MLLMDSSIAGLRDPRHPLPGVRYVRNIRHEVSRVQFGRDEGGHHHYHPGRQARRRPRAA